MEPKINREDLPEIVEETARLDDEDKGALAASEAKQILRELDLPAERLDDARRAVAERHDKRQKDRKARVAAGIAVGAVVCGVAYATLAGRATTHALEGMTVAESSVSLHGGALPGAVPRASNPEISFDVVLANPPHSPVELSCDWTTPDGTVRFQSRWKTKSIDKDRWPTHCHHSFSANEPAGTWSVSMRDESRALASGNFELQ